MANGPDGLTVGDRRGWRFIGLAMVVAMCDLSGGKVAVGAWELWGVRKVRSGGM